jgi:hypothetical protein
LNHTSLKRHCLKKMRLCTASRVVILDRASDSPSSLATTPIDGTPRSQNRPSLLRTPNPALLPNKQVWTVQRRCAYFAPPTFFHMNILNAYGVSRRRLATASAIDESPSAAAAQTLMAAVAALTVSDAARRRCGLVAQHPNIGLGVRVQPDLACRPWRA